MAGTGASFEGLPAASLWAIEHSSEIGLFGAPLPAGRVEVALLTDPWSVWCWGWEPARRAIEHRFPGVRFRALVGGMFPRMPDPDLVGFNVERFFAVVQRTTGMPIKLDATRGDRPESTYPACIHVAAIRLLRPDLEPAFLRGMREAVYLDGRNVSRSAVAAAVAEKVGVAREEFLEALASGEPEREFRETIARLEADGLHAYPTFLVRSRDQIIRVEGFQSLPALMNVVEHVSGRLHAPEPAPAVVDVVRPGERVATREVAEVLDVSVERAFEQLAALEAERVLARERHPTGDVWRRASP